MERYLSVSQCLRGILTYPMLAWDTHLPNACVGRQAFPMNVTGRQAEVQSGSASITRQSARRFVPLIDGPTHHTHTGGDMHQLSQSWR